MKLNNKGFAITGILYGLLILFALLVGSYLTILTARKNRLDGIVENIENEYGGTYTLTLQKGEGISVIYYSKDNINFTQVDSPIDVIKGDVIYYYATASNNYFTNCSSKDKACSVKIKDGSEELTITGSLQSYTLRLTSGTGVDSVCYKTNDTSTYTCSTTTIIVSLQHGTIYSYYATAKAGYTLDSCNSLQNACSAKITKNTIKMISSNPTFNIVTVTLVIDDEDKGMTTVTKGDKYTKTFTTPTSNLSVTCTNGQQAYLTTTGTNGSITIDSVTATTKCTITYG